jgi:hypothetical protein
VAQSFGGRYAARDRALFLVGLYTGFAQFIAVCRRVKTS